MILDGHQPPSIARACQQLREGALLGLPTETVYGLAADAGNDAAVRHIFQRKGRPATHPLIVHIASAAQADHFACDIPPFACTLMQRFWPGPLTLILPRRPGVAEVAAGGHPSIGLRCPSHPVAQQVLHACLALPEPVYGLAAPSANRFGKVSPTLAAHVQAEFGDALLVLDGGACEVGIESTILDCTRATPTILRPGQMGAEQMQAAIGIPVDDLFAATSAASAASAASAVSRDAAAAPAAPGTLAAHYAPRAKVRLMDAQSIQAGLDILGPQARHMAVYARSRLSIPAPGIVHYSMPDDPAQVAHELFRVLRELDAHGVALIWVEALPNDAAWNGVRDRLQRAAASA